jgi:hypothetical protein
MDELADSKAFQVFEETRTPLEQWKAQLQDLNDLLGKGKITADLYGRGLAQAFDKLKGSVGGLPGQGPAPTALVGGSQADVNAQLKYERSAIVPDTDAEVKAVLEAAKKVQEDQLEQQKAIRRALEKAGQNVVGAEELGI